MCRPLRPHPTLAHQLPHVALCRVERDPQGRGVHARGERPLSWPFGPSVLISGAGEVTRATLGRTAWIAPP
jgi:hypothetical protein